MWLKIRLAFVVVLMTVAIVPSVQAQGRRPKPNELRSLDFKAEQAQQEFLNSLFDLAKNYEEAGAIEKSREMLNAMLKINPDAELVKKKLKEFDEAVFGNRIKTIDVDTSLGWTNTGVVVTKDKPFRIEATGSYKFIVNADLGPEGYDEKNAARDLVVDVPTGALMGMIATKTNPKNRRNPPKPEPFFVGSQSEITPEESGVLLLKVNVPPLAKCIGKLKVKLSGNISQ